MLMTGFMGSAGNLAEEHGTDAEPAVLRQNADRVDIELPCLGFVIYNPHNRIIFTDHLDASLTKRLKKRTVIAAQSSRQLTVNFSDQSACIAILRPFTQGSLL